MDTLTQAVLGAAGAQAVFGKKLGRHAGLIGAWGGIVPDLDVFLGNRADPLAGYEIHRGFTHSLAFVPVGALLTVLPFWAFPKYRRELGATYFAAFLGYLTHAPLDTFTSYGTQLGIPFTLHRYSLDWVAIVDPLYTLPLLALVIASAIRKSILPALIGLIITTAYLGFGGIQNHRALEAQRLIAESRGHVARESRAMPMIGSLLLWRSLYEHDGRYYADAVRVGFGGDLQWKSGESGQAIREYQAPADWPDHVREAAERDFKRFRFFTQDRTVLSPDGQWIGDARYAMDPGGMTPMWGIRFDPTVAPGETPTRNERSAFRDRGKMVERLWETIQGRGEGFVPVAN